MRISWHDLEANKSLASSGRHATLGEWIVRRREFLEIVNAKPYSTSTLIRQSCTPDIRENRDVTISGTHFA